MSPAETEAIELLVALAEALHRRGLPAHRLEDAMTGLSRELGQEAAFFSTPTSLLIRFGPPASSRTTLLRVEPSGGSHLARVADLDRLADRVAQGHLRIPDALVELRAIEAAPSPYPAWLSAIAAGLVSGAASVFFGATAEEVGVSSLLGLGVGLLDLAFSRWTTGGRLQELISAFLVAAIAAHVWADVARPPLIILTGLIALVPGLGLTTALSELATRNLVSGTARLTAAGLSFLQLTVGVALAARWVPDVWRAEALVGTILPPEASWAALVVAGVSVQILFSAHLRHLPWVFVSVFAAVRGAAWGAEWLGPNLGALVGALAVGCVGNLGARILRRPAMIGILPGLLLLVPGSLGMRALASLVQAETLAGIETAVSMGVVGMAIVTGLLSANILVSPRRSL